MSNSLPADLASLPAEYTANATKWCCMFLDRIEGLLDEDASVVERIGYYRKEFTFEANNMLLQVCLLDVESLAEERVQMYNFEMTNSVNLLLLQALQLGNVADAFAALRLTRLLKKAWELDLYDRNFYRQPKTEQLEFFSAESKLLIELHKNPHVYEKHEERCQLPCSLDEEPVATWLPQSSMAIEDYLGRAQAIKHVNK